MVRKLYKHEFIALLRVILPLNIICIALSLLLRISQSLAGAAGGSVVYALINSLLMFAYVVSLIAITCLTFALVVVRFYRHLLSAEGYLSMTLPVKTSTHIVCKLVCGTAVSILSTFIMALSLFILWSGYAEFWTILGNSKTNIRSFLDYFGIGSGMAALYVIEIILTLLTSVVASYLMAYAAMTMGQRAKKRVLMSVVWYFVFNMIRGFITNIVALVASISFNPNDYDESAVRLMFNSGFHWVLWASILLAIIWSAVFYVIAQTNLKKRLNLE